MECQATTADGYRLLHDGALALAQVEAAGVRIDTSYLKATDAEITQRIATLEAELKRDNVWKIWRRLHGMKANLGSKPQLAKVVFGALKYPSKGKTEKGNLKSDEAAYAHITNLPFLKNYFRVEKLKKLKGTYLKGLAREVTPEGYLHAFYNLHTVTTFRSSSDKPNFQNIPIRNREIAEVIRKAFIPRRGRALVEIDFSGAEVRVSACYNKDPALINYIKDPTTDMHRDRACDLFLIEPKDVEKRTTRDWAKNRFVFPQFYGSVYFQCAPSLWEAVKDETNKLPSGISVKAHLAGKGIDRLGKCDPKQRPTKGTFEWQVKQAEDLMWDKTFHIYRDWKERWWRAYCRKGYFDMYTGFRCKGLYKRNDVLNYAVQGSAFHCLLWTLIELQKWITKSKLRSKIVGQIHDCVLLDVPLNELQDVLNHCHELITKKLVEAWQWIIVPMDAECEVCTENWWQKNVWTRNDEGVWGPKPK